MNYKILQRISDELAKEKPDLSYMKGMVDTLLSMDTSVASVVMTPKPTIDVTLPPAPNLKSVNDMIKESVSTL